jgi:hypothetical protein
VTIGVIRIAGKAVRLGITAPREVPVHRREVAAAIEPGVHELPDVCRSGAECVEPPEDRLEELAEEIRRRIEERAGTRLRNFRVETADGRIIVHGVTPSYYARQLVYAAALEAFPSRDGDAADTICFDIQVASK